MRVLVTGAGGTLGTLLAPMLADEGHEPVLMDIRDLDSPYEFVLGDVRSPDDVRAATRGVEFVIHLAAIIGTRAAARRDFYDINLTGTFNVWEAAAAANVRGLVFSSTMSVYKPHDAPVREDALTLADEDVPPNPRDLYGYTKAAGEGLSRLYGREYGIPSVALRYGMFSPEPFFPYGIRLLYGGVDAHDVARAVLAAMDALAFGGLRWGAFNVESLVPFREEDGSQLLRDPLPVLEKYYPGAADLLRERGVESLRPIREIYPMDRAADALGFRPACNVDRWLEELRSRPEERAARNPPWP